MAKNRHKAAAQEGDFLEEWFEKEAGRVGHAEAARNRKALKVIKSKRSYSVPEESRKSHKKYLKDKVMPGAVYYRGGKRCVLAATKTRAPHGGRKATKSSTGKVHASWQSETQDSCTFKRQKEGRFLPRAIPWEESPKNYDAEQSLRAAKGILFPELMPMSHYGLGYTRTTDVAFNAYMAIRHAFAWHDHPEGGITVNLST